jgi:hypothetical protein
VHEPSLVQPNAVPVVATEYILPETRDIETLFTLTEDIVDASVAVIFTRIASELLNIESFTHGDETEGLIVSIVKNTCEEFWLPAVSFT